MYMMSLDNCIATCITHTHVILSLDLFRQRVLHKLGLISLTTCLLDNPKEQHDRFTAADGILRIRKVLPERIHLLILNQRHACLVEFLDPLVNHVLTFIKRHVVKGLSPVTEI